MSDADPIDRPPDEGALSLRWSGRVSLTPRILFVNIFALALLAGGFFYLDSYRARIVDGRVAQAEREVRLIAEALTLLSPDERTDEMVHFARKSGLRLRIYDRRGRLVADSRQLGVRNFQLRDPDKDGWQQDAARALDAVIDTVVRNDRDPLYRERAPGRGLRWPDVVTVRTTGGTAATVWRAPDRTPVVTAAAPLPEDRVLMATVNARDITQTVRTERARLSMVLAVAVILSVLLSLFLARTIVRPMRMLARAAIRVRLGRDREVVVPRLPSRRDEIGMLARSLSDMTAALRSRIDATEAFAADVTHELKNPLASLRSAVDGLATVRDPDLRNQLLAIVQDDVHRLDRLITDISDASRLDGQLARAKFEDVDLAALIAALVAYRVDRGIDRDVTLRFDRDSDDPLVVHGEGARLERVFANLIDNAISFSPPGGEVRIGGGNDGDLVEIEIVDDGPGVPPEQREAVFRRFHSVRPGGEAFGQHSGLGLAIARTIVEGHGGMIAAESRRDSREGARFVVQLPIAGA
ncbi:histidine kinase [Sphingomonas sp. Leaf24]|uniref:sensor histidine kinase n=1 Tax=unclassified Sphingomonas TaxID=196159 RepID=UPI0006F20BE9|nr:MULTISPECIES: stimulus-sensing domain-containing protein [unclassified Sphingomonas]KQM18153.1 histidine kinase [Sphingomonas sp. Leaf5]KQM89134.1 histidine kinase [Sphingomonas sp. Leaf24]